MKKYIALGLVGVMMVASLVGCQKKSSDYLMDIDYSDYVQLCDYKGAEATKVVFDVTDEDIQEEIEYTMYDYVTYDSITDRGVEVGDYANITYTTTIDGEVNEEYSGEEEDVLVGEGYIYSEVEDALVGMKTGDTVKVEVKLTSDYAEEELVGKTAMVDVTLNEISVENMPEYNEEFVKENTEFDTMDAYEQFVKESLEESKKEEYQYTAVEEIFEYLVENSEFNGYPEELYTQCEEAYDSNNEYYAAMYGVTTDEMMEMFGIDEETKKEEVEHNVNYELVIGAIAQQEGIDCTEKEITDFVDGIYEDYGYEDTEAFFKDYSMDEIGYELIYQKVCDFLYENAKLVEMSEEDYLAEQQEQYSEENEADETVTDEGNVEMIPDDSVEEMEENEEQATEEIETTSEAE